MRQLIAGILAIQLAMPVWAAAQQQPITPAAPPPAAPQQSALIPGSLKVLVLEGQGAVNSIQNGRATPPVVEIRDRDDRPVEGATVEFRLPASGPGGTFAGKLTLTVSTGVQGQAMAVGLLPNQQMGSFKIHVTATAGSRTGETDILQTNTANQYAMAPPEKPKKKSNWWKWAIVGGVAAGAAIGIILATRGDSSTANPNVTITPGSISIGGR